MQSLQSVVSMASECYILTDLVSFKCDEVGLGSRLSERSRTFVTELAYGGTHHEASMKHFLETCSPWLQMHVAEILLANYTDLSVPFEKRHLKSKTLSLEKIVSNAILNQSATNKKIYIFVILYSYDDCTKFFIRGVYFFSFVRSVIISFWHQEEVLTMLPLMLLRVTNAKELHYRI